MLVSPPHWVGLVLLRFETAKGSRGWMISFTIRCPASENCACELPKTPNKAQKSNRFTISKNEVRHYLRKTQITEP
jgi:hypothetical protein